MIGQDFPKIEWHFAGLDLLEPNAMIGDFILFCTALFLAEKIKTNFPEHPFYINWRSYYIVFAITFLLGGLGHLFYNYSGIWGKYPAWLLGMVATYFITKGMLSLWPHQQQKKRYESAALVVLLLGLLMEMGVFVWVDMSMDQSKGLFIPTLISGIGFIFSLVYIGISYQTKIHQDFKILWMAALILLPNTFIQSQKINLHQWFDRNDLSHVLLLISLILYYTVLRKTREAIN